MNTLHLLSKATNFASSVHRTQKRKGTNIPYITHPLAVSKILARVTPDNNVIIAGILHDTIEDCKPYGSVTKDILAKEFNAEVARMVDDVTEVRPASAYGYGGRSKKATWMERKMKALAHIKDMPHDSLLVKSADVLHNLSELNNDIENNGNAVFEKFNASKEDTVLRYKRLIPEIKKSWDKNPLLKDLEIGLTRLMKFK